MYLKTEGGQQFISESLKGPWVPRRLCGTIQIASFHPQYRFAGTEPNAAENYTNRSPYPMLHLLRETSVSQAAEACDEILQIPRRNIEALRNLGREDILKRLQALDTEP